MDNCLETLRKHHQLTQDELAKALKVSRQTISSIENGRYDPSLLLALNIAEYFNTTVEHIFFKK